MLALGAKIDEYQDMNSAHCTCGNPNDHVIARRVTADGKHVLAWNDGTLTWALGYAIRGSAHPRTPEARERARQAAWLVLEDVCLFDASEVPALIKAARWAAERGTGRDGMWARLRGPKRGLVAGLVPQWTTLQADRDGRPTVRIWRLPRLAYPGLAVWHERGRYDVVSETQRGTGTYARTGHTARTLRDLGELLQTLRGTEHPFRWEKSARLARDRACVWRQADQYSGHGKRNEPLHPLDSAHRPRGRGENAQLLLGPVSSRWRAALA